MAAPFRTQRSSLPFSTYNGHIAVIWNNATIVWDLIHFSLYFYHSGEWSLKKTIGYPRLIYGTNGSSMRGYVTAEVLNDKMIMLDAREGTIFSLDLTTWVWEEHKPEGQPPPESFGICSWLHKQKIYFFGGRNWRHGRSSRLFCYDYLKNCWEWPTQAGDIPPPRLQPKTIISGDTVFLFGGGRNDLHILNMEDMIWKKVHDAIPFEARMAPVGRVQYTTFTLISPSTAVFYGSYYDYDHNCHDDSWLLDLNGAKQFKDPSLIWSRIPNHHHVFLHEAVLEPVSQSLWVIGGFDGDRDAFTSDLLKMSCNIPSLKNIAIDHVARSIKKRDQRLLPNELPQNISKEIEDYRSKMGDVHDICSTKEECQFCQQNRTEN